MRRLVLLLFLLTFPIIAHAQSGIGSLPLATQPLTGVDNLWINQGSGCATNGTPCAPKQTTSIRLGQPVQQNCGMIVSPFQYQQCIDTSDSPPIIKEWIGSQWWPFFTLNGTTGPVLLTTVGSGGGVGFKTATLTSSYVIQESDNGTQFNNAGASGTINATLPAVNLSNGSYFCFNVYVAQPLTITPQGTDQIVVGQTVGLLGSPLTSSTTNSSICLQGGNTNQWVAVNSPDGVWTLNGVTGISLPTIISYTPLNSVNNLSDVANAATSRTNLGLGSIAVLNSPLPVANGGTALTSGTSGGILGYTASGVLASSVVLGANGVVIGGGAGATPTAITAGTAGQLLVGTASAPAFATPASALTKPSNPAAITPGITTAQMLGMGGGTGAATLTPVATGRVQYSFDFSVLVASTTNGASFQCSHGTGVAPANAASVTGTQDSSALAFLAGATTEKVTIHCGGTITGLTLGTAVWFDVAVLNTTGAQAVTVTVPTFNSLEF